MLCLCLFFSLSAFQSAGDSPKVFIDNYETAVTEGMYINCLKINDLSVITSIPDNAADYDQLKLELHRFGESADILAAYKTFIPSSNEFQKKYAGKSQVKFRILTEETELDGSDMDVNTLLFPKNSTVNMAFCKSHDLKQCSWYVILRGYKKTGEKTQFDEDVMDKGTDLGGKSVMFKSWEDKRK